MKKFFISFLSLLNDVITASHSWSLRYLFKM